MFNSLLLELCIAKISFDAWLELLSVELFYKQLRATLQRDALRFILWAEYMQHNVKLPTKPSTVSLLPQFSGAAVQDKGSGSWQKTERHSLL